MTKAGMRSAGCLAIALQCLAACHGPPPPQPLPVGTVPVGAAFVVAKVGPDISRKDIAQVVQCLVGAGMSLNGKPDYYVQLVHTLRLGKTVVLLPDPAATGDAAAPPASKVTAKPAPLPKNLSETLTVTVSDNSAQEVFRASATKAIKIKPNASGVGAAGLTDLLCRTIPKPK